MMLNLKLDANPINTAVPLTDRDCWEGGRKGRTWMNCKTERRNNFVVSFRFWEELCVVILETDKNLNIQLKFIVTLFHLSIWQTLNSCLKGWNSPESRGASSGECLPPPAHTGSSLRLDQTRESEQNTVRNLLLRFWWLNQRQNMKLNCRA